MRRRTFLTSSAAGVTLPAVSRAKNTRMPKFIPQSDVTILDPIWTQA